MSNSPEEATLLNFGSHWHSNLEERLQLQGNVAVWFRADGRSVSIERATGRAASGFSALLHESSSGTIELLEADGTRTIFGADGRLRSKLNGGHGLSSVVYNDEAPRADCPAGGPLRICAVSNSRGVEFQFQWSSGRVVAAIVGGATNASLQARYSYGPPDLGTANLLVDAETPRRHFRYSYSSYHPTGVRPKPLELPVAWALSSVDVVDGTDLVNLERHDWFDDHFPEVLRGRVRFSKGAGSSLGFRWARCNLGASEFPDPIRPASPYCQMGSHDLFSGNALDDDRGQAGVLDIGGTDRDSGQFCLSDDDCPQGTLCWFIGTVSPGGRCRQPGNVVNMSHGRVTDQPTLCSGCSGPDAIVWDAQSGTKVASSSTGVGFTSYLHDDHNRITRIVEYDTDTDAETAPDSQYTRTTDVAYDADSGRVSTLDVTSVYGGGRVRSKSFGYDAAGRIVSLTVSGYTRTESSPWSPVLVSSTTTFEYVDGLLTRIDGPRTDVDDSVVITYYPPGASSPDDRGRPSSVCRATGAGLSLCQNLSAYTFDGKPRTIVDENGVSTSFEYDPAGRLISRSVGVAPARTTAITYDGFDRVSTVREETGRCRTYSYGPYGTPSRVVWSESCLPGATVIRIDDFDVGPTGEAKGTQQSVGSQVIQNFSVALDSLGRPNSVSYNGLPGVPAYRIERNTDGIAMSDASEDCWPVELPTCSRRSFMWDAYGAEVSTIRYDDGLDDGVTLSMSYDRDGHIVQIWVGSGEWAQYEYDDFGNVVYANVSEAGGRIKIYDAAGQLSAILDDSYGDILSKFERDALGRITKISHGEDVDCATASDGTLLAREEFSYDVPPADCSECLNSAGRLVRSIALEQCENGSPTAFVSEFGYDAFGSQTFRKEGSTNAASSMGGMVYSYLSGRRLASVTFPDGDSFTYVYDADGTVHDIRDRDSHLVATDFQYDDPVSYRSKAWTVVGGGGQ